MTSGPHPTAAAPRASTGRPRAHAARLPRRAIALLTLSALLTAIAWLRLSPTARDTLWAEDGRLFLQTAAGAAPVPTLFTAYGGYLQLAPRILALLTVHLTPVHLWAQSMTLLSCTAAGAISVAVFVASREHLPWLPARLAVAALPVLTPLATREVLGNATNLHSLLFWGIFWVMLSRPGGRARSWGWAAFVLVGALSEIQALFLLPLLLWRLRDRRTWPVKLALLVGLAAQLVASMIVPRQADPHPAVATASVALGWVINAIATSWLSIPRLGALLVHTGGGVWTLTAIPAVCLGLVVWLGTRRQKALGVLLLGYSAIVWGAGVIVTPAPWLDYARQSPAALSGVWLSRYGVVPAMLLLALLPLAATALRRRRLPWRTAAAWTLLVALAAAMALHAPADISRRSAGPAWQPQVHAARLACQQPGATAAVFTETLGWKVAVPCRDLARWP